MTFHPYLYEKLVATRHDQILHDMELSRLQASTGPKGSFVWSMVGSFGTLLIEWGSYMQRVGQRSRASLPIS